MKLAIFGASGRTGLPLVRRALTAGHEVIGIDILPWGGPSVGDRFTFIQRDVLNGDLSDLLDGVDAVLSTLGFPMTVPFFGSPVQ